MKHLLWLALLPMFAHADAPSFNEIELGYSWSDSDEVDFDTMLQGPGLLMRFEAGESFFINAGYFRLTAEDSYYDFYNDFTNLDIETSAILFGVGYHMPISDNTDFFLSIDYSDGDIDLEYSWEGYEPVEVTVENSVFTPSVGIKSAMGRFDLEASLGYAMPDEGDDEAILKGSADLAIGGGFGFKTTVGISENTITGILGVTYNF